MDNQKKRTRNKEVEDGNPLKKREKEVDEKEEVIESVRKKGFSTLPRHLQELVLTRTDPVSRNELYQTNNRLRNLLLLNGPFGRDLKHICVYSSTNWTRISTRDGSCFSLETRQPLKHILTCERLVIKMSMKVPRMSRRVLKMAGSLPTLVVADLDIFVSDFEKFCKMFLGYSFEVTRCFTFRFNYNLWQNFNDDDAKTILDFIDSHQKGCKFVDFGEFPIKKALEFLQEHEFVFVDFLVCGYRDFDKMMNVLRWILKYGVPGTERSGISLRLSTSTGFTEILRMISNRGPITMGNTAVICQEFMEAFPDLPGTMTIGGIGLKRMFGFKWKFDSRKNLVFLLREENNKLRIVIRFEKIRE